MSVAMIHRLIAATFALARSDPGNGLPPGAPPGAGVAYEPWPERDDLLPAR
jgi:hypothetical protein